MKGEEFHGPSPSRSSLSCGNHRCRSPTWAPAIPLSPVMSVTGGHTVASAVDEGPRHATDATEGNTRQELTGSPATYLVPLTPTTVNHEPRSRCVASHLPLYSSTGLPSLGRTGQYKFHCRGAFAYSAKSGRGEENVNGRAAHTDDSIVVSAAKSWGWHPPPLSPAVACACGTEKWTEREQWEKGTEVTCVLHYAMGDPVCVGSALHSPWWTRELWSRGHRGRSCVSWWPHSNQDPHGHCVPITRQHALMFRVQGWCAARSMKHACDWPPKTKN